MFIILQTFCSRRDLSSAEVPECRRWDISVAEWQRPPMQSPPFEWKCSLLMECNVCWSNLLIWEMYFSSTSDVCLLAGDQAIYTCVMFDLYVLVPQLTLHCWSYNAGNFQNKKEKQGQRPGCPTPTSFPELFYCVPSSYVFSDVQTPATNFIPVLLYFIPSVIDVRLEAFLLEYWKLLQHWFLVLSIYIPPFSFFVASTSTSFPLLPLISTVTIFPTH
jgi:hypothetical protein